MSHDKGTDHGAPLKDAYWQQWMTNQQRYYRCYADMLEYATRYSYHAWEDLNPMNQRKVDWEHIEWIDDIARFWSHHIQNSLNTSLHYFFNWHRQAAEQAKKFKM